MKCQFKIVKVQIDDDITQAEKYDTDKFVWIDEMKTIGEKLQNFNKEVNGKLENKLADNLLAEEQILSY